jgi:redox-sensitive bicupin YhaK (pirin superfamily)
MTAGAGILHIEAPPEELVVSGGLFHGIQLWVNLPRANKWNPPRYQDIRGYEAALLTTTDGGALLRLIAGDLGGQVGPGSTFTPITMVHATISPGARVRLPWRADFNTLAYVLAGNGSVGADRRPVHLGQLAVYGPGDAVTLAADSTQDAGSNFEVLLLGGQPIGEPVVHYGPFVMNTKAEIVQAMEDYQAGRLGTVPAQVLPHRHPGDVELAAPVDQA